MATIWIFGAGGIGLASARAFSDRDDKVLLFSREVPDAALDVIHQAFDLLQDDLNLLDAHYEQNPPDGVIVATGVLHNAAQKPEKNVQQLMPEWFLENMAINCLPAVRIAQYMDRQSTRKTHRKMLVLSARVGSITDNQLGGWYSYRASKAALNMLLKTLAIEWRHSRPNFSLMAYHPGTVDTPLSKPFSAHVPQGKLFSPEQAAAYLLTAYDNMTPVQSGSLIDWEGKTLPY